MAGLGSAPGKVWTWKSPLRPTGEGARDGRACAVAPEPAPRPPLPGPCALPARSLPRQRSAGLPRAPRALTSGSGWAEPWSPRLGTPVSHGIPVRSGPGVRLEEPRESGSEMGSRGGECARVWRSERARECACLTRGEVCKGRIPSFLPQPLVETRRMQRPPGRSVALCRAAGGRRAGPRSQPGNPAPRPDRAPPSPAGPGGSVSPAAGRGKAPGEVLLLLPAPIRAKGAPPGGEHAPPCLAAQLPRGTRGRLDPVPITPLA